MNVLVTDGENRSSLAVTRSLARKGVYVIVTGREKRTLSSSSKFCHKFYRTPDPLTAGVDYAKTIAEIVRSEKIRIVFPTTEQSIYLLNQARDILPFETILACSLPDQMDAISNKIRLFKLAKKLKVPAPHTIYLSTPADLASHVENIDQYPVVIKPALSRIPRDHGFLSGKVMYAASRKELEHLYATETILEYPSMIQEKINGPGTGLFTLYDVDHHLALFSHRRLVEKPPSGGVSVISESVPLDEEMVMASDRLLSAVQWSGVAMVEFKRDLRDGLPKLMEINGRFWGSLQLGISCGIDFPGLFFDYLNEKKPSILNKNYPAGYQLRWLLGVFDVFLILLKSSRNSQSLNHGLPSKWQPLASSFRKSTAGISNDTFDLEDIGPFAFELSTYIHQAVSFKNPDP